ncbi:sulfatase [Aeoliella sp. ICT_H6.2]|uniref:Sulfatase n=1 Tax=Aeoliella straminimaris TaxID=2954799 RepID=A0A9X2F9H7_9BACT|nr:sulfatase [Aeoliella straminimaris]MCO6044790.1 sulfatase [Aeoliella straminimaris]
MQYVYRRCGWLLALGVIVASGSFAAAQPNIVLIMADDLGWCDTSNPLTTRGHASDFYETPAIDRLAAEGMALTNAYTNGPNCAPTRAAILSGQWAQRPTNNIYQVDHLNRGGPDTLLVGPRQGLPRGDDALPTKTFTYAEHLRDNGGYATAHVGKFHVATSGRPITQQHGFLENMGGGRAGAPTAYHCNDGEFGPHISSSLDRFAGFYSQDYVDRHIKPYARNQSPESIDQLVGTPIHVSDAMADAATWFMEQHKTKPLMVQFHPFAVHTPIGNKQARRDLLAKYQAKTPGDEDRNASFAALIEGMDQSVARLIDYLQTTDDPRNPGQTLDKNTLVIFLSDNGGKQPQSNNGPLKGQKGELDEGGIRVPMVAWSGNPTLVDRGTVNHTPVSGIDLYPTFAALAGAGLPEGVTLDGADLSGILADAEATLDRDALYWHLPGYLIGGGRDQHPQSVIRAGKWKLLYNYEDQSFELYDLEADLAEANNLASSNPQMVRELGARLIEWLADTAAPLATVRAGELEVEAAGPYYADGEIREASGTLTLTAGDEVPLVLPAE